MNLDLDLLTSVSIFIGFEKSELQDVLNNLNYRLKYYTKNQSILVAGNEINALGILLRGAAHIVREDFLGNRMIVAELAKGDIFAETFVCAGIKVSPVSVFATNESEVLFIPFERILYSSQEQRIANGILISNLLKILSNKNIYLNQKMELLSKRTIREKIMAYLVMLSEENHSSEFYINLKKNELADYLCIDRSAMSRELSKMKKDGIIDYKNNYFKIIRE